MDEIKLTLGTVPVSPDATEALTESPAQTQAAAVAQQVQEDAVKTQTFTPEEEKMIEDFSKQIDIKDSNLVFSYGAGAQQNIAQFSDSALNNVKTKDMGEVGGMITGLVQQLKGFTVDEEEGNVFTRLFRKQRSQIEELKLRYNDAETNVNQICEKLEGHQIQLLKDIAMLDKLYEQNLHYFKELSMYIAAGKLGLENFRKGELAEAIAKAETSGLPEDAQAAKDLSDKAERFEKKIYDLELTRNISIQMAPQIRLVQSSNQMMAEKIQTSLVNTIPLWKSQMVLALGVAHTQSAIEAQKAVTDLTNELLQKNAEKLKMATVSAAKESERGIVDIETLTKTNQMLMETMDEVLTIQRDGHQRRMDAEKELANIEDQLRKKLLEINR